MKKLAERYKGKRVVVTGGAGFIGSHLVEALVSCGAAVTVFDNLTTGKIENLTAVRNAIQFVGGTITNQTLCSNVAKNKDIIFHLAALVSVPQSVENPDLCKMINIAGTENMLKAAIKNNVQHFVFSSSCAVYGNQSTLCSEQTTPRPTSPYADSKLKGEALCNQYSTDHNLIATSLRYFNVYGERQNPNGDYAAVVAKFKNNLRDGKPITIFGDGTQTRDFIHVTNVVKANLIMGISSRPMNGIINIASGKSITILELIESLKKELRIEKANLMFAPARLGDIHDSQADCNQFLSLQKQWAPQPEM